MNGNIVFVHYWFCSDFEKHSISVLYIVCLSINFKYSEYSICTHELYLGQLCRRLVSIGTVLPFRGEQPFKEEVGGQNDPEEA